MRVHKDHRIDCPAEKFWEMLYDGEFDRRLNVEGTGAAGYEVLERDVSGGSWRMRVKVSPKDNMPGFIKKLVGNAFSYEELRTHEKGADRGRGVMTPSTLKDKLGMSYEMQVVPDGPNACRRIIDWDISVKIFGIGGQIEKFASAEVERGLDASARYYNAELAKQAPR